MKKNLLTKKIVIGITILFLGASIIPSISGHVDISNKPNSEQPFKLRGRGTLYVGGGGPDNYSKIQDAIDDANPGDTIFVYDDSAPYNENLFIEKSIDIIGEKKETTIIDGGYDLQVIWLIANIVTISNFTLRDAEIGLIGITNGSIISDIIISCQQAGIGLMNSTNNQIINNEVKSGYDIGIGIFDSSNNNVISNNVISNTYIGLYIAVKCYFNKIFSNIVKQSSKYGIWIHWSFLNLVTKNNFIDNGCNAYFENSSFNLWFKNYWDDWSSSRPRPIEGIRYGPILKTTDPWKTYDLRPAKAPYD